MKMSPAARKAMARALANGALDYQGHRDEYDGLCYSCGEWKYGEVEPDARGYECEECGEQAVHGAEEAAFDFQFPE
jgi:hypothetical protein